MTLNHRLMLNATRHEKAEEAEFELVGFIVDKLWDRIAEERCGDAAEPPSEDLLRAAKRLTEEIPTLAGFGVTDLLDYIVEALDPWSTETFTYDDADSPRYRAEIIHHLMRNVRDPNKSFNWMVSSARHQHIQDREILLHGLRHSICILPENMDCYHFANGYIYGTTFSSAVTNSERIVGENLAVLLILGLGELSAEPGQVQAPTLVVSRSARRHTKPVAPGLAALITRFVPAPAAPLSNLKAAAAGVPLLREAAAARGATWAAESVQMAKARSVLASGEPWAARLRGTIFEFCKAMVEVDPREALAQSLACLEGLFLESDQEHSSLPDALAFQVGTGPEERADIRALTRAVQVVVRANDERNDVVDVQSMWGRWASLVGQSLRMEIDLVSSNRDL